GKFKSIGIPLPTRAQTWGRTGRSCPQQPGVSEFKEADVKPSITRHCLTTATARFGARDFRIFCAMPAVWLAFAPPAAAGTPTSCERLLSFAFPNTTISSAVSVPGGPYVAPDVWHLAFTNLPPSCQVSATIKPSSDSNINVQVWMPTQRYNGRYLGTGNGGYA